MGSVDADQVMQLVSRDAELVGPVGDIGSQLRVDLFQIVRPRVVLFVHRVRLVRLRLLLVLVIVLGHRSPLKS